MKISTKWNLCIDSLDYTQPVGATNDDHCNDLYINEVVSLYNRKISYLELGCAGGSIVDRFVNSGHDAYGIEGTDHPIKIGREAWKKHHNTRLFTCDLSKPFSISENPKFDVVSAWEFMEHIPEASLNYLMAKIYNILNNESGMVIFGISYAVSPHHLSVFQQDVWKEKVFDNLFITKEYNLINKYREDYIGDHKSFFVILTPKKSLSKLANQIIKEFEEKFE